MTSHDDDRLIEELREAFSNKAGGLVGWASFRDASVGNDGFACPSPDLRHEEAGLPVGTQLGEFTIIEEIGRGGMGIVYRAKQDSLGREVALKVLPGHAHAGRSSVRRFRTEAKAAAKLTHTNVVSIFAQGEHQGLVYYAMELVDGVSLNTVVRSCPEMLSSTWAKDLAGEGRSGASTKFVKQLRGSRRTHLTASATEGEAADEGGLDFLGDNRTKPRVTREAANVSTSRVIRSREDYRHLARLFAEVADGLHHAHQQGVVHRDIKPHNLLLGPDNALHITDFGLARLTNEPHLTIPGEIMGTPAYLSPEQVRGDSKTVDHRADIYALGVTLYEILAGKRPFEGETREQIIDQICRVEPTAPRRLDSRIPIDLETICLRAMSKETSGRHQTAEALADDLRRFAEGRPILSRRVGPVERAGKWVKRHKSLSTAIAAFVLVAVLAIGLGLAIRNDRQARADALLDRVYDQLAHKDYREVDAIQEDLTKARDLGTSSERLEFLEALVLVGRRETGEAVKRLSELEVQEGASFETRYACAWVLRRDRQREAALSAVDDADRDAGFVPLGSDLRQTPLTAEAWFWRGLAIHFDRPADAIESYRQAIRLRGQEGEFYPQAVLHLARARNQQMYKTRAIDGFEEADSALRQLVNNGYYSAYPHYLLSISHRLAAEIYRGSEGTRGDQLVDDHYQQALFWAREGQRVDPSYERPVTAEAEYYESVGAFEEALEMRTRAIETGLGFNQQCEGYHYRWRLHYWLGRFDEAMADVEAHRECRPGSIFYDWVYPALIEAERGRLDQARAIVLAAADPTGSETIDVIWASSMLRLFGQAAEAESLLFDHSRGLELRSTIDLSDSELWTSGVFRFCLEGKDWESLEAYARSSDTPWACLGEAHFHAGVLSLAHGDRKKALEHFGRAYRSYDNEERYTFHAKMILNRMKQNPTWPEWIESGYAVSDEGGNAQPRHELARGGEEV